MRVFVEAETSSETNESKTAERLKPAKESKIQDRINLFNNKGPNWHSFALPMTRMRNQSTPTKLLSQAIHGAPAEASSRLLQRNRNTTPRVEERSTEVTATTAADIVASSVLLETVAN
jgi:Holliday junction resolvase-like predicted endonuclease